jgi:pimeloyl-ACP methyl ester carboxylesterase
MTELERLLPDCRAPGGPLPIETDWRRPAPPEHSHHSIPPQLCRDTALLDSSDGVVIRLYELEGDPDAPPLIFGHGCGFAAGSYLPFLSSLEGFRVFAFDARGHGGSTAPRAESTAALGIESLAADLALVARFVADRAGRAAHYVGHSMSGTPALWLLASGEDPLFSGFTLFDPAAFPEPGDPTHPEALASHHRLMTVCGRRRAHWASRDDYAAALTARGPFALWSAETIRAHIRATTRPGPHGGLDLCCRPYVEVAILHGLMRPAIWRALPTIDRSVHLVGADPSRQDREWVTACIEAVARRLPNATLDILSGTHHVSMFADPDACRALIARRAQ